MSKKLLISTPSLPELPMLLTVSRVLPVDARVGLSRSMKGPNPGTERLVISVSN